MAPQKPRTKSRSPAPSRTPTTPSQFFPPSYFAAAAGVPYPLTNDGPTQLRAPLAPGQQEPYSFSSNGSYEYASSSTRRKSRLSDLDLMEPNLLPTLSDTVERMTRPPSQVISSSPLHPVSGPDYSPAVARTPSTSSQSSSAYSVKSEHSSVIETPAIPVARKQSFLRSLSHAHLEQPPLNTRASSSRTTPKSILKVHMTSDQHPPVRQAHLDDVRHSTDHTRKAGRSCIPVPSEPLLTESRTEYARQVPISPRSKVENPLRSDRAHSRTDPGTLPKGSPATHGRNPQPNPQPSGIPRRVGIPPSPVTTRVSPATQLSNRNSETESGNATQREKRRLFVTNAEISSSSSSESQNQAHLMRYPKPKQLARTDSRSSAESQLRPARFGLGLGLPGVSESRILSKFPPGHRWATKVANDGSLPHHATFPSKKRQQRDSTPKGRGRSPCQNTQVKAVDGQRRQRELLSLVHSDLSDSQPSSSEGSERCLVSDGSGDSFDDSGSEYSPTEEDDHTLRTLSRRETKQEQTRSKAATGQSRVNFQGDSG